MVGEAAEAEGAGAKVFDPSVDGFGRSVRGARPVEVGIDVDEAFCQGPFERGTSFSVLGTPTPIDAIRAIIGSQPVDRSGR